MRTEDRLKIIIDGKENEDDVYGLDYFKNYEDNKFLVWLYRKRHSIEVYEKYEIELLSKKDDRTLLVINHKPYEVKIKKTEQGYLIKSRGWEHLIRLSRFLIPKSQIKEKYPQIPRQTFTPEILTRKKIAGPENTIIAPMTGKIIKISVNVRDKVKVNQQLAILESMKMETEIAASKPGTVKEIRFKEGNGVCKGDVILIID